VANAGAIAFTPLRKASLSKRLGLAVLMSWVLVPRSTTEVAEFDVRVPAGAIGDWKESPKAPDFIGFARFSRKTGSPFFRLTL
jgi:hypothetical protein